MENAMEDSRADELWEAARGAWDSGDLAGAVNFLEELLQRQPGTPAFWTLYADILAVLKRWPESEKAAHRALALDPDSAMAYACLGYMNVAREQLEEAEKYFRKAHELLPQRPMSNYLLGVILYRRGAFAEAETYLRRAIELKPSYDEAYYELGVVLAALGKHDEANQMYSKAVSLNPDLRSAKHPAEAVAKR